MPSADSGVLVVLTANRALFHQVYAVSTGLEARFAPLHIEWMPDPMQLVEARRRMSERHIVAAVLDLTTLQTTPSGGKVVQQGKDKVLGLNDTSFTWQILAMLAVFGGDVRIPLLIVSENRERDRIICANSVVRRIEPSACDEVWNRALSDLAAVSFRGAHDLAEGEDVSRPMHDTDSSSRLISLSPDVQIDVDRWVVLAGDKLASGDPRARCPASSARVLLQLRRAGTTWDAARWLSGG